MPPEPTLPGDAKFSSGQVGDFMRIVKACGVDLDNLARDDIANGVVAINQMQGFKGEHEGAVRIGRVKTPLHLGFGRRKMKEEIRRAVAVNAAAQITQHAPSNAYSHHRGQHTQINPT
jgi:hypothetical protein